MTVSPDALPRFIVTCEIQDCLNFNVPIDVPLDPITLNVICGPCGNEITNIVPIVS
jgi:hypothetical protein